MDSCDELQRSLTYSFNDPGLLVRALTRKAYANEQAQRGQDVAHQEVLRTLGDAVLKAILVDRLIRAGYDSRERITTRKMELESEEGLAERARTLDIGAYLRLGKGERKLGAHTKAYVLAETLEAVIGAVYLDGGYDATMKVVLHMFDDIPQSDE